MKFFSGLFGKKGGTKSLCQEVLGALKNDGVDDAVWQRCVTAKDLEDVWDDECPRRQLSDLAARKPRPLFDLCARCVGALSDAMAAREALGQTPDEASALSEATELALGNAAFVLARVLAAGPGGAPGAEEVPDEAGAQAAAPRHPLMDMLWDAGVAAGGGGEAPLGERAADAAMRLLFLDGFTVDAPDPKEGVPEAVDGVEPGLLWAAGVGPEGGEDNSAGAMQDNRRLALQLLAALVCAGAPAALPKVEQPGGGEQTSDMERVASARAAGEAAAAPLLADGRALAYLSCPGRSVPRRGELLYSLLSVAFSYDPRGYSVPYAGYFTGSKEEAFVRLCLQVLGLLLQEPADLGTAASDAWRLRRPQEQPGDAGRPLPEHGPHAFRQLLAGISSEREVAFMVDGVSTLLGTISDERGTYLPKSIRVPEFLPELLMVVFHLSSCDAFVVGACGHGEIAALVEGILHVPNEAPDYLGDDTLALLTWATLVRLTTYREVCIVLNEDFKGDPPADVQEFSGSLADLVALAALTYVSDYFVTTRVNLVHHCIVEAALSAIANTSVFAEDLCIHTSTRFFAVFERSAKSVNSRRGSRIGAVWLPYFLEIMNYIVQYQYATNSHMAYGILTRLAVFKELQTMTAEPAARLAAMAAPPSASPGGADPATPTPNGSASPRSECSAASADVLTESQVATWQRDLKQHLDPLMVLLDEVVPQLEAEVQRKELTGPDEVKSLLPKTVLGLLPRPPAFVMRNLRYNELTHRACEHCLVACAAHGPLSEVWEEAEDEGEEDGAPSAVQDAPQATATPAASGAASAAVPLAELVPTTPAAPAPIAAPVPAPAAAPAPPAHDKAAMAQVAALASGAAPPPAPASVLATRAVEPAARPEAAAAVEAAAGAAEAVTDANGAVEDPDVAVEEVPGERRQGARRGRGGGRGRGRRKAAAAANVDAPQSMET